MDNKNMISQLELLAEEPLTTENLIKQDVRELKEKHNNLRKGLFKRFDALNKEVKDLRMEIISLKQEKGRVSIHNFR